MPADELDVRQAPALIMFSAEMLADVIEAKTFLRRSLYRHPQVVRTTDVAKTVVHDLFAAYETQPVQLPADHARRLPLREAVVDYVAGMTDRFALKEHRRLTGTVIDLQHHLLDSSPIN
jgi:dGTPase